MKVSKRTHKAIESISPKLAEEIRKDPHLSEAVFIAALYKIFDGIKNDDSLEYEKCISFLEPLSIVMSEFPILDTIISDFVDTVLVSKAETHADFFDLAHRMEDKDSCLVFIKRAEQLAETEAEINICRVTSEEFKNLVFA